MKQRKEDVTAQAVAAVMTIDVREALAEKVIDITTREDGMTVKAGSLTKKAQKKGTGVEKGNTKMVIVK